MFNKNHHIIIKVFITLACLKCFVHQLTGTGEHLTSSNMYWGEKNEQKKKKIKINRVITNGYVYFKDSDYNF